VLHTLAAALAAVGFLDPKNLIESIFPFGEIAVMAIVFAETGLLIGLFLPGDSLLFSPGLLANDGKLNMGMLLTGVLVAAVVDDQVGSQFGKRVGPSIFRKHRRALTEAEAGTEAEKLHELLEGE
jgi:membrane-associated protein